jgi:hypothetical protein
MLAMNAPREAVLLSSGEEFVFLGVVEILDIQTTLLFVERLSFIEFGRAGAGK